MKHDLTNTVRKLNQQFAYTSIQMHETVAQRAGISGTDHKYLGFLIRDGAMTAGELAQLSGLTTGAVTGLIDRFEKKKLVKRTFAENDRRKVIIEPDIAAITALLEPLYKDFRLRSEKLLASFSTTELQTIQSYFEKAIGIMTQTTDELNNL